jgi:alpha-D-ribose 1-methylphosphonate 5-triphosphate synthase subunit PhnH
MHAMARPGLVRTIEAARPSVLGDPYLETLIVTLCDSRCSFTVAARQQQRLGADIALLTYARPAAPECADFALISADAPADKAFWLLGELAGGSLLAPERSATVLCQCDSLSQTALAAATCGFSLRGPGIAGNQVFFASSDAWYRARALRNDEFPCGIDIILFDRCGNLVCVPRTTVVKSIGATRPSPPATRPSPPTCDPRER